jgi:hypothetical protein
MLGVEVGKALLDFGQRKAAQVRKRICCFGYIFHTRIVA